MAESMHVRIPARQPVNRRPRIPHPHLAPQPAQAAKLDDVPAALASDAQDETGWTPAAVPMARPAGRPRRGRGRRAPAERTLRSALHFGVFVNLAALLASRLFPAGIVADWGYGGDDFLLAAAVLLSGYALLAAGRLGRRQDEES
jgi:hypothetical protein